LYLSRLYVIGKKLFTRINFTRVLDLGVQNFSDVVHGKYFKIWGRETSWKKHAFSAKNWPYLGNGKGYSQD